MSNIYIIEKLSTIGTTRKMTSETNDARFADMSDFDDSETASSLLLSGSQYSVGDNISKKPQRGKNCSLDLEQDLTTFDDLESELSEPPIEESSETNSGNKENSCRLEWA